MSDDQRLLSWLDLLDLLHDWSPGATAVGEQGMRHERAWAEVDRRLRRFIAAKLATGLGLTREDVEDITQASLLKLQGSTTWRRFRTADSIVGYLLVLVRNQALDVERRRSVERAALQDLSSELRADSLRESRDATAALERLRSVMDTLLPAERQLIDLRFWRGMRLDEIADKLGVPYSTVAGRMFRLLHKLQREIRDSSV
jgi:RNA polymerase sigma factor (sigma-70 family)